MPDAVSEICLSATSCQGSPCCLYELHYTHHCIVISLSPLVQDGAIGSGHNPGHGGTPHRSSVCAERGLQVLCRPPGLHQGSEPEQ